MTAAGNDSLVAELQAENRRLAATVSMLTQTWFDTCQQLERVYCRGEGWTAESGWPVPGDLGPADIADAILARSVPADAAAVIAAHDGLVPSRPEGSRHVVWLEQNLGHPIGSQHARCVHVLGAGLGSLYNLPLAGRIIGPGLQLREDGMVSVLYTGTLGSYDESTMTRLMIESHRHGVRVEVCAWVPIGDDELERDRQARLHYFDGFPSDASVLPAFEIRLCWRDTRTGGLMVRHPSMWRALASHQTETV